MRVRGVIQPTAEEEITAEADDAQAARALIEAQVPDGYEILQVHNAMPRGGRVIATGKIRRSETQVVDGEGTDYVSAREAMRANVPEGYRVLQILTVE
jgi:hypothetical protein